VKYRVHYVLTQLKDQKDEVSLSVEKIAELANVSKGSVSYILGELCRGKQIIQIREGRKNHPAAYQVVVPAVEVSQVET
jgi:DNA-binding IscR family transcriptional regulator